MSEDRKAWLRLQHEEAAMKAREHLDEAEVLAAQSGFIRNDKLADHVMMAEAWSRYALAVKP